MGKQKSSINPEFIDAPWCDQITVATAGVSVQGGNIPSSDGFLIKASPANTGTIYVWWQAGDGRTHGWPLSVGDTPLYLNVDNLNRVWFDASAASQVACWQRM